MQYGEKTHSQFDITHSSGAEQPSVILQRTNSSQATFIHEQ